MLLDIRVSVAEFPEFLRSTHVILIGLVVRHEFSS